MIRGPRTVVTRDGAVTATPRADQAPGGGTGASSSLTVFFYDTSTGSPTTWLWTVYAVSGAVLATYTIQNPTHTFLAAGTYRVTLLVSSTDTIADHMVTVV